jgi:hypothetical protein
MIKKSKTIGSNVSAMAEIKSILRHGIVITVNNKLFFMPFAQFPWFFKATVEQIYNVTIFNDKHLYWPELDVDIDVNSLEDPEAYPLKYSR